MRLVYFSPVPQRSFAQRPHKFVAWFHQETQGEVLWIDPYPTRFPSLADRHRVAAAVQERSAQPLPPWLEVLKPRVLPIEPLPLSGWINAMFWHSVKARISAFADGHRAMLAIGKPSVLALAVLRQNRWWRTLYDAMDDFPAFYSGLSRVAMTRRERRLVRRVDKVMASSTALQRRWGEARSDVLLVRNGLDAKCLPPARIKDATAGAKVLGYVGTIAGWFDWEWVIALAECRPIDRIRLIGPVFAPFPGVLPGNVELLAPCSHEDALKAMQDFDVGVIPFKKNALTSSVDPIKFYEYRAMGLPVVSTGFGEMALREGEDGAFIVHGDDDIGLVVEKALRWSADAEKTRSFVERNDWSARFNAAQIL